MKSKRVLALAMLPFAAPALIAASGAQAQPAAYPSKPVRIMIGYAPGGPADLSGRVVAPKLTEALGQTFFIETRGGAGGTIGMDLVAKATPDGYTIGLGSSGNLVMAPQLYPRIPYNVQKDLIPVAQLAMSAYVIAVNPTVPAKTVPEFIKLARGLKNPLNYGTSGNGSTSHVAAELLGQAIAARLAHVPYKGTGPALAAVVAGEIDMMVADLTPALPHAASGRLRILGTVSSKRPSAAPHLPTMAEAGVKMHPVDGRYGIVVPAGTPRDVVARLHAAIITVLKAPDVQQRYAQMGFDVVGDTPGEFAATLKTEGEVFGGVIRRAGIKPDA
ncbi:MAG: tripartite tricarboxylate transporter substrate binding protein [Burkholderiales bacterium]|nr:tripartite tricarboxylate transporter substrate binding protein [Burkholderiales bacterium]